MTGLFKIIAVLLGAGAVTFLTRILPFLFFSGNKKVPDIILFIEKYIPGMIMVILVIYCLKDISPADLPLSAALILSSTVVALLHMIQKNALISIFGGTLCYMVFVQSQILEKLFDSLPAFF